MFEIFCAANSWARQAQGKPSRSPDWQEHDSLVVQAAGEKRWRLYTPTFLSPRAERGPSHEDTVWEGTLQAGDCLYIPWGWWHEELPTASTALYLVFRFTNPRGSDLLGRVASQANTDKMLRLAYPRFGDLEQQSEFLTSLQRLLMDYCTNTGLVQGALNDIKTQAAPHALFSLPWSIAPEPSMPPETHLVLPLVRFPGPTTIKRIEAEAAIFHNGAWVRLDDDGAAIFDALCREFPVALRTLAAKCEANLPGEKFIRAFSVLLRAGLIGLIDPDSG